MKIKDKKDIKLERKEFKLASGTENSCLYFKKTTRIFLQKVVTSGKENFFLLCRWENLESVEKKTFTPRLVCV